MGRDWNRMYVNKISGLEGNVDHIFVFKVANK